MAFNKKLLWLLLAILVIIIVVVVVVVVVVLKDDETDPEVTIPQGLLRGINLATHHNREIYAFKGIPFAEPPVGNLRFAAPVAASGWDGTLEATAETANCAQATGGAEDCLYLNLYTPLLPKGEDVALLPVMVFIHGGGFRTGSNNAAGYGPDYLLDKDVLLVVPSYRLGILGFLSTGDEVVPGNNGLKDLVMALQWIHDNIAYFGGDASRVTVFGQSAGGSISQLLALSDLTDGLMHGYIAEGGTALSFDGHRPTAVLVDRALRVGESLGCSTATSTQLVSCLRTMNTSVLFDSDALFKVWDSAPSTIWSPTIEPDIQGAFLTEKPGELLSTGRTRNLPFIAMCCKDEGINPISGFYNNPDMFDDFLVNMDLALGAWLSYDTRVENSTAYTETLKSYYLNDFNADRSILLNNMSTLMTDALCGFPSYSSLRWQVGYAQGYLSSFDYRGVLSGSRYDGGDTEVAHGDELIYLFPTISVSINQPGAERSETDWEMVDTMVQLWTSFATNLTPDSGTSVRWEQFTSLGNYLKIGNASDNSLSPLYEFSAGRMQFWEELTANSTWL